MFLNIFCFSLMTWVIQSSVTRFILWDKDTFIRVLLLQGMIFRPWLMIERQGSFLFHTNGADFGILMSFICAVFCTSHYFYGNDEILAFWIQWMHTIFELLL